MTSFKKNQDIYNEFKYCDVVLNAGKKNNRRKL